jgi:hypothetical protein
MPNVHPFLVTITQPVVTVSNDVGPGFPNNPPGTGLLCKCLGSLTTAVPTLVQSICVLNKHYSASTGDTSPPSDTDTKNAGSTPFGQTVSILQFTQPTVPLAWPPAPTTISIAAYNTPTSSTTENNILKVLANYLIPDPTNPMMYVPGPPDIKTIKFVGSSVPTCSNLPPVPGPTAFSLAASQASSVTAPGQASPTRSDGDWLLYESLSVSPLFNANVLMLGDELLVANVIAVSVPRVSWYFGSPPVLVHRAAGSLLPPPTPSSTAIFLLSDSVQNAISVWQDNGTPLRTKGTVVSECREHPDVFSVDSSLPIRVLPNVNLLNFPTLQGSFDLWVKVIC